MARLTSRQSKAYRRKYYLANQTKGLQMKKCNYQQNAEIRRKADKKAYEVNSQKSSMPKGDIMTRSLMKGSFKRK